MQRAAVRLAARTTAVFVERTPPAAVETEVGVKGAARAMVNPRSRGSLPSVVLSQEGFDPVRDMDVDSLRFGLAGDEDSVVSLS